MSVQNSGVRNEDLNNVIQLIQNTIQSLVTFEKQFTAQKVTETTHYTMLSIYQKRHSDIMNSNY